MWQLHLKFENGELLAVCYHVIKDTSHILVMEVC